MDKSTKEEIKAKTEIEKWGMYAAAVKQRDAARREAEELDKARRKAWREYYIFEGVIKELDQDLGIVDVSEDVDECPPAPKKTKHNK